MRLKKYYVEVQKVNSRIYESIIRLLFFGVYPLPFHNCFGPIVIKDLIISAAFLPVHVRLRDRDPEDVGLITYHQYPSLLSRYTWRNLGISEPR